MKLPWKKENAAHKAPGGGKRRSFDLKAALTTRAVRVGGYSVAAAAIVIAIIVAANALVRALPAQWTQFDTTSSQLFSISDQTENVVGSLETPVTIHWIVQSGQEDATLEDQVTLRPAFCLGNCGEGVSVKIDGTAISDVTTENAVQVFAQHVLHS